MLVESVLNSRFLKRNFFRVPCHCTARGSTESRTRSCRVARAMLVGIRQAAARRAWPTPRCFSFPSLAAQTLTNFSQRICVRQLAKQHGHELSPRGEPAACRSAWCCCTANWNSRRRKQLEQLGENGAYSIHGGGLPRLRFGSCGTRTSIYWNFRLNPKPNLDRCGFQPATRAGSFVYVLCRIPKSVMPLRRSPAGPPLPHQTPPPTHAL